MLQKQWDVTAARRGASMSASSGIVTAPWIPQQQGYPALLKATTSTFSILHTTHQQQEWISLIMWWWQERRIERIERRIKRIEHQEMSQTSRMGMLMLSLGVTGWGKVA
jgi:hypothetical protein